jgi:quercetin dioxygenase-like cupin family protein
MTMKSTKKSHVEISFRTEAAPVLRVMGERITPLVDRELGAAAFEVFEVVSSEGSGPPPNGHPWAEAYVVAEGQLAVTDWSRGLEEPIEQVLGPGDSAYIPGNAVHSFQARSERCRFTVVSTRGAHAFFADVEETLHGATDDLETVVEVAKRNRMFSPLF